MAQIDRSEVLKERGLVISVREYCEDYARGLTSQAIYYALENDLVDWVSFGGREKYLVMTEKTRQYVPNRSIKRNPLKLI